jgi:hypothetical protein
LSPLLELSRAELAKPVAPFQLAEKGYRLYQKFRREIPPDQREWGVSGKLDLDLIREMATA